ncbi:hypothetical protein OPT61_g4310 [Boeremia exigua]|uniref:Uncharacterized protein n=1 Tax=Boeremia exigua TaxID=749465 RepID=A0ACC2IER7_9PLEO|nr:hypothetical protein OPT61_g4310 [Boeremia exigua]
MGDDTLSINVEFSGGLELLFANQKKYALSIPSKDEAGAPSNVAFLVRYLCDEVMKDPRKDMFVLDDTVRPGILVLINEADWELEGEDQYELQKGDHIIDRGGGVPSTCYRDSASTRASTSPPLRIAKHKQQNAIPTEKTDSNAMASSEDDEDLKLAMAMSLQQSPSAASTNKTVIDLTSDNEGEDEDDDLKRAIALSLQDGPQYTDTTEPSVVGERLTTFTSPQAALTRQAAASSTTLKMSANNPLAMDRKAMEAERLQRLAERKRKRSSSPDQPSKQKPKTQASARLHSPLNPQSQSDAVLQYPRGAVKRTFATKFPRTDDITIDELLQAPIVNIAVISSFQWDAEWLSRKLSHSKVKQHWVMNARDAETQARWRRDLAECGIPNLRIHFPPMNTAVGNAHSKYMLLVSEKKMRVVVSTANMEREYWGEVANDWQPGVLENSVFIIDLPRRADGDVGSVKDLTPFGKEMVHFLEAQQLDPLIVKGVLKFDFSQTAHLAFVHSIGSPTDVTAHPTGLPGLAKAIQYLQLDEVQSIELDYAASSLGAIDEPLLQRIYLASQGLPFDIASTAAANLRQNFRIYYPTTDTIKASVGGPDCAGVVSLRKTHYASASFPAECLRDHVSIRKGVISHSKLLFARGRHVDGKPFAWVYIGSANISESAWGAQKVLKSGKLGKLTMRNWECGVIVPVPKERLEALELEDGKPPPMSVFEGTMEVPFQYPGEVQWSKYEYQERLSVVDDQHVPARWGLTARTAGWTVRTSRMLGTRKDGEHDICTAFTKEARVRAATGSVLEVSGGPTRRTRAPLGGSDTLVRNDTFRGRANHDALLLPSTRTCCGRVAAHAQNHVVRCPPHACGRDRLRPLAALPQRGAAHHRAAAQLVHVAGALASECHAREGAAAAPHPAHPHPRACPASACAGDDLMAAH